MRLQSNLVLALALGCGAVAAPRTGTVDVSLRGDWTTHEQYEGELLPGGPGVAARACEGGRPFAACIPAASEGAVTLERDVHGRVSRARRDDEDWRYVYDERGRLAALASVFDDEGAAMSREIIRFSYVWSNDDRLLGCEVVVDDPNQPMPLLTRPDCELLHVRREPEQDGTCFEDLTGESEAIPRGDVPESHQDATFDFEDTLQRTCARAVAFEYDTQGRVVHTRVHTRGEGQAELDFEYGCDEE